MEEASAKHAQDLAARHKALTIAAVGVVFGDIGTSPLYMMKETFGKTGSMGLDPVAVYGVLSLAFWSLMIVVSVKYCMFIMRADNKGEGGVLSLASLALRTGHAASRRRKLIWFLALAGLALFYGDALITPSVSVLSAVEGLRVEALLTGLPAEKSFFDDLVVPLATAILIALFLFQSRGTRNVGRLFGPIMILWFATIGLLGLLEPYAAKKEAAEYAAAGVTAVAMEFGAAAEDIARTCHAHPTLNEVVKEGDAAQKSQAEQMLSGLG